MLKSLVCILALAGALLATSVIANAQLSHKDTNGVLVSKDNLHYKPGSHTLCKVFHMCK